MPFISEDNKAHKFWKNDIQVSPRSFAATITIFETQ